MIIMPNFKIIDKLKNVVSNRNDIDIHGSCVSRDIFRFDTENRIVLGNYFARNSFISAVSEPFPEEVQLNLLSPWQEKIVEIDLKKELFEKLAYDNANYLIIDFIDERFELMKYKSCIFSVSSELLNSKFTDDYEVENISRFDLAGSFWKKALNEYIDNLLNIYDEKRIIIHETYFVDSFINNKGQLDYFPENKLKYGEKINNVIEEYYDHVKNKLPNAHVVNIIENYNLASENHKWGLAQVHYEDAYYKKALTIIDSIVH